MACWMIYIRERFPILSYLILSLGFAVSGAMARTRPEGLTEKWLEIGLATLGLMLFFGELRLMDEFKDYEKDRVAHPDRPLPRKLLELKQVEGVIRSLMVVMLGLSGIIGGVHSIAGALYLFISGYLWLMYKEFYRGELLSRSPFLYALTHQIVVIPLCLFCIALGNAEADFSLEQLSYSGAVLGAFFAYEICRKLDPKAHPILKTYLSFYGPAKTIGAISLLLMLSAICAFQFQSEQFLWPMEMLVGLCLIVVLLKPSSFKGVEAIATLSLVLHIWAYPLQSLVQNLLGKRL